MEDSISTAIREGQAVLGETIQELKNRLLEMTRQRDELLAVLKLAVADDCREPWVVLERGRAVIARCEAYDK